VERQSKLIRIQSILYSISQLLPYARPSADAFPSGRAAVLEKYENKKISGLADQDKSAGKAQQGRTMTSLA
jgi:hypothetical protein